MNDWVNVRLTALGAELAQGAPFRVMEGNGGQGFEFVPGEPQRVTRAYDWERVLKTWAFNGHPLFELAPEEETVAEAKADE